MPAFATGAKEHRTDRKPPPSEQQIPDELPRRNILVRLNDYQLEMLRYLAEKTDVSQQKVQNRILVPPLRSKRKNSTDAESVSFSEIPEDIDWFAEGRTVFKGGIRDDDHFPTLNVWRR